jgi:hypothetical protein
MTNTKIRVDIHQGIIEAEGSEEFVRSIYEDFKERVEAEGSLISQSQQMRTLKKPATKRPKAASEPKKKKAGTGSGAPSIVKDLDLSGSNKAMRLRDFYSRFSPLTNFERNLIFVYYLSHELEMTGITVDHIFTCYRDIPGVRTPNALQQSLWDTSSRRGWLDTSSTENIKVTMPGINYLEHDMPKGLAKE